jgi:hypothetical protein
VYTVDRGVGLKLGRSISFRGASVNPEVSCGKTESGIRRLDYRV